MNVNIVNIMQAGTPVTFFSLVLWGLFLRASHDKVSRFLATLFCGTLFLIGIIMVILIVGVEW